MGGGANGDVAMAISPLFSGPIAALQPSDPQAWEVQGADSCGRSPARHGETDVPPVIALTLG